MSLCFPWCLESSLYRCTLDSFSCPCRVSSAQQTLPNLTMTAGECSNHFERIRLWRAEVLCSLPQQPSLQLPAPSIALSLTEVGGSFLPPPPVSSLISLFLPLPSLPIFISAYAALVISIAQWRTFVAFPFQFAWLIFEVDWQLIPLTIIETS